MWVQISWLLLLFNISTAVCMKDVLPLFYVCLDQWTFPFVIFFVLVVAFSFSPTEIPLAFVVKLVWWYWILLTLTFVCKTFDLSFKSEWEPQWVEYSLLEVFSFLSLLCHFLLVCRLSAEKSADSLMGVPLYVICCFSLLLLLFSLCL